jgi:hypothetical protein
LFFSSFVFFFVFFFFFFQIHFLIFAPAKQIPAIIPKLKTTPGETLWHGPELGEHNEEIICGRLGVSAQEFQRLKQVGAIGSSVKKD